ncbi:DUF1642 domain-containing protein [Lactococcus petauri]|uniref:DUF1642 domain-containing protein n=1 Tax=Lactococcus petauri TaxID=1940789 RepID=UPI0025506F65|nr:DUF1642 domain-containing protein [Lactococcus petauri]
MTKFEEKLEILPIKTIQHPVGDTKYYTAVHVKTLIAQADEEIANLKSKLQQQALPVVPKCVAGAIAWDEQMDNSIAKNLKDIFTASDKYLKEAGLWIKNNPEKYIIARNIGYTVEKPQLFYLKNKLTDMYLYKKPLGGYGEEPTSSIKYLTDDFKFTQQEIDSMETGSYEQIEVEK